MKTKLQLIAGLCIFLVTISCKKKSIETWDKEENLETDTSLLIYSHKLISYNDSDAVYEFEIVQLNNLESETIYNSEAITGDDGNRYKTTLISDTIEKKASISGYSSIFLFESTGYSLYERGQVSFYLSRYFELLETTYNNKRIAFATFETSDTPNLKFHQEKSGLFNNSANFNDSLLVNIISQEDYFSTKSSSDEDFKQVLFDVIDVLANSSDAKGQKSITIFDDYFNNNVVELHEGITGAIINKANQNNIKINVVCNRGSSFFDLAGGTGGFFIDDRNDNKVDELYWDYRIADIANNVANLDRLLSNDVTTHKFRLNVRELSGIYSPNSEVKIGFQYNKDNFIFYDYLP